MTDLRKSVSLISGVFFLSGCSTLIFETIWFRVTSLVLGSSVWSAAAVLMAFMGGLALGNALMAVIGHKIVRLLRVYIIIELAIGLGGVLVVVGLPVLAPALAKLLAEVSDHGPILQLARFLIAVTVLLIPAVAMGATLPLVQKILRHFEPSFRKSFGGLYGWNTLGAVAGTLSAEFVLVGVLGIFGTAVLAMVLNLIIVLLMYSRFSGYRFHGNIDTAELAESLSETSGSPSGEPLVGHRRLLLAAGLAGMLLLALEVVWFRYLLLAQMGTSTVFATMLAVVLSGIGLGGLVGARIKTSPRKMRLILVVLPLISTVTVGLGYYSLYPLFVNHGAELIGGRWTFVGAAMLLMFPSCMLSGILFTLYGAALYDVVGTSTRASGATTFANTVGAAIGSGLATFLLLPVIGVETSFLLLTLGYVALACLIIDVRLSGMAMLKWGGGLVAALAAVVIAFPYGTSDKVYAINGIGKFPGAMVVAIREGLNETAMYYRWDYLGEPLSYRLATNGFSMSGTEFLGRRYMGLYAYFPYIFKPNIEDVLLISYGVGNTSEAIMTLDSLKSLDVVDISRDVLELSEIAHRHSGTFPLEDPRTRVFVEDGRFHLQVTDKRYDLITGEPPPPKHAGVVNLYSREYFSLMRSRLKRNGVVTYWLPAHDLDSLDALAIVKAFCDVFQDCSMWNGGGLEFMLVGSRGGLGTATAERLARIWDSPQGAHLRDVGFMTPADVAATFVADSEILKAYIKDVRPVTDDQPHRISPNSYHMGDYSPLYADWLNIPRRWAAFNDSEYPRSLFPKGSLDDARLGFIHETWINQVYGGQYQPPELRNMGFWENLLYLARNSNNGTIKLLTLDITTSKKRILARAGEEWLAHPQFLADSGKLRFADADYIGAAESFAAALQVSAGSGPENANLFQLYLLSKGLADDVENIDWSLITSASPLERNGVFVRWFEEKFAAGTSPVPDTHR